MNVNEIHTNIQLNQYLKWIFHVEIDSFQRNHGNQQI